MFLSKFNKPFTRQTLWDIVKKYVKKAGIDLKISPHFFRHTFATDLVENGMSEEDAADLLGHCGTDIIEEYRKISTRRKRIEYDEYNH